MTLPRDGLRRPPAAVHSDLLRVLTSPSYVQADIIRQFYERPDKREFAEVLLDLDGEDFLRAALVGGLCWLDTV